MKQLLKITFLLFPALASAQVVQVYVNDTTFTPEPVTFSGTDTTNGKLTATYPHHNNALAYEVNFFYGSRSGLVKTYYPGTTLVMSTTVYAKGQRNGETAYYNKEGALMIKGTYVKDVKNGFWVYKNYGFMGEYKNGLKHGYWKYTLPGGIKGGRLKFKKGVLVKNKKKETPIPTHIPRSILMEGVTQL